MIGSLTSQIDVTSLGETLYTIAFTVFFLVGIPCCFLHADRPAPQPVRPPLEIAPPLEIKANSYRRRRASPATARATARARQLSLPLRHAA